MENPVEQHYARFLDKHGLHVPDIYKLEQNRRIMDPLLAGRRLLLIDSRGLPGRTAEHHLERRLAELFRVASYLLVVAARRRASDLWVEDGIDSVCNQPRALGNVARHLTGRGNLATGRIHSATVELVTPDSAREALNKIIPEPSDPPTPGLEMVMRVAAYGGFGSSPPHAVPWLTHAQLRSVRHPNGRRQAGKPLTHTHLRFANSGSSMDHLKKYQFGNASRMR